MVDTIILHNCFILNIFFGKPRKKYFLNVNGKYLIEKERLAIQEAVKEISPLRSPENT